MQLLAEAATLYHSEGGLASSSTLTGASLEPTIQYIFLILDFSRNLALGAVYLEN